MLSSPTRLASTAVALALVVPAALLTVPSVAGAAPAPTHQVAVTASGTTTLTTWPAYDASVPRYAVVPSVVDGSLTVTASTTDPAGRIQVDGHTVPSGQPDTLTGLQPGDEVSVIIDDAAGHSAQSWIYLPATFPHLSTTGALRPDPSVPDGHVFLTLGNFLTTTPYETVVDGHAVPSWFEQGSGSDLKPVDLGATRYSMARKSPGGGWEIDELDARFDTVATHQLDGPATSTDFHDSELLPGGRTLLLGYDPSQHADGKTYIDAVIQIVDATGHATFTWNSKDHVDPSEAYVDGGFGDYAHVNSLQYLPNSDILASFRNLGQVMRIAGPNDPSYSTGHVIWRLGGQRNDFTYDDDPLYEGNCAQHMARLLPDGHLMLFDNGSVYQPTGGIGEQSGTMCADPADPTGPRVAREQTRVTEYALDQQTHTADLVWSFVPADRYVAFAGSQQRLDDSDTVIGWSQAQDASGQGTAEPVASQVTADGDEVWTLFGSGWFSYRAAFGPSPDAFAPAATVTTPADGARYVEGQVVDADFGCTDTGGSSLDTCTGAVEDGDPVATTPGSHAFTVVATDGAGNRTTHRVHYTVDPLSQPDGRVRAPTGGWIGDDVHGGSAAQRLVVTRSTPGSVRTRVSVQNDGVAPDRMTVRGTAGSARFGVRYLHQGVDVTGRVVAGTLRTGTLAPGATYELTVVTRRTAAARAGQQRAFVVEATSLLGEHRHDAVAVVLRATR